MNLLHYTKNSVKLVVLAMMLNACAGVDANEDPSGDGDNNAANANEVGFNENSANNRENANNAADGDNGNNLLDNENLGGVKNGKSNEFVNNAVGENFLGSGGASAGIKGLPAQNNLSLEENSSKDLGIKQDGAIVSGNQDAGANPNIAPPNSNMGAIDASLAPRAGASTARSSGGSVHYIVRNGTSAYDKPNGSVVKNYEQGDHPLVSLEGEFVRTSDGTYVTSSAVTSKPVPRAKSRKSWR
ncbi:MAG: hypothetical protein H7249_17210 [Chitinophagaceae bacterium]|nr:hypothetical protein [Oligoflexus sp.]